MEGSLISFTTFCHQLLHCLLIESGDFFAQDDDNATEMGDGHDEDWTQVRQQQALSLIGQSLIIYSAHTIVHSCICLDLNSLTLTLNFYALTPGFSGIMCLI